VIRAIPHAGFTSGGRPLDRIGRNPLAFQCEETLLRESPMNLSTHGRANRRDMRGSRMGPAFRHILFLLLALSCPLASLRAHPGNAPRLYKEAAYREALALLHEGKVDKALDQFCRMYAASGRKELWTLSVNVLCSVHSVPAFVRKMTESGLSPVVLIPRVLGPRRCVRIGYGLARTRGEAAALFETLPGSMRETGPFPVRIPVPCPGFNPPPAHAVAQSPQKAGPAPAPLQPASAGPAGNHSAGRVQIPVPSSEMGSTTGASISKLPSPPAKAVSAAGEAWFRKGVQALGTGETAKARRDFQESLKSDPGRPEVLNNLAITYISEGRYRKARDILQKVVAKAPGYSRAHLNLAGALWGLGQRKDAVKEARLASRLDNDDINAHLTLATFLTAQGLYEEAKTHAQIVLILDPGNLQARRLLNRIERKMKAENPESSP
jgi:hypothetical protein